eukprot:scaffold120126_cov35-Prasinocladus_malaysianus.AAC.1
MNRRSSTTPYGTNINTPTDDDEVIPPTPSEDAGSPQDESPGPAQDISEADKAADTGTDIATTSSSEAEVPLALAAYLPEECLAPFGLPDGKLYPWQ